MRNLGIGLELDVKKKYNQASVSEVLTTIKNKMNLLDKDYAITLKGKMDNLEKYVKEMSSDNHAFLATLSLDRLEELHKNLPEAHRIEDLLYRIINKLEGLKDKHEESAAIYVKLNELLSEQDEISVKVEENFELLKAFKKGIAENNERIKENVKVLRERLGKVKK